jgi:hypothetical protein
MLKYQRMSLYQSEIMQKLKLKCLKYNMYFSTTLSQIKVQGLVYCHYNV